MRIYYKMEILKINGLNLKFYSEQERIKIVEEGGEIEEQYIDLENKSDIEKLYNLIDKEENILLDDGDYTTLIIASNISSKIKSGEVTIKGGSQEWVFY